MNHFDSDLILLLRLNEGHLTGDDATAVRDRFAVDARLKERWDRLRQVLVSGPYSPAGETATNRPFASDEETDGESAEHRSHQPASRLDRIRKPGLPAWPISAEMLAAFAEGSLSAQDAERMEARIWESPRLIYEVSEAFRFRCQPPAPRAGNADLTSRLLALGSDLGDSDLGGSDRGGSDLGAQTEVSGDFVAGRMNLSVNSEGSLLESESSNDRAVKGDLNGSGRESITTPFDLAFDSTHATNNGSTFPDSTPLLHGTDSRNDIVVDVVKAAPKDRPVRRAIVARWTSIGAIAVALLAVAFVAYRFTNPPELVQEDERTGQPDDSVSPRDGGELRPSPDGDPSGVRERDLLSNDDPSNRDGVTDPPGLNREDDEGIGQESNGADSIADSLPHFPTPDQGATEVVEADIPSPGSEDLDLDSAPNRTPLNDDDSMLDESELVAMQWQRVEGLLAVRDDISGSWMGASAERPVLLPTSFATLPGSWASAQTDDFGEVVMGEDTEAQFRRFNRRNLSVRIEFGNVALKDVPLDTTIRLQYPLGRSLIRVLSDGTDFGVTVSPQGKSIVVRRGKIRVGNRELSRGQKLSLAGANITTAEANGEFQWFDRPGSTNRVPRRVVDRLMISDRLLEELSELRESNNATIREAGVHWGVSLEPDASFVDMLLSNDLAIREDAFRWLVSQPPHRESLRQALASLARRTGDPSAVRMLYRWSMLARTGAAVPKSDAVAMLRILNHDDLAIRVPAAAFLRLAFGKTIVFDVEGRPTERRMQLNRLEQVIIRHYDGRRTNQTIQRQRAQSTPRQNGPRQNGQVQNGQGQNGQGQNGQGQSGQRQAGQRSNRSAQ